MNKRLFTSESVTEGHPDKICDQISDAILDAIIEKDKNARVACEVAVATGLVMVMGEITTDCYIDIQKIARSTIEEIGYDRAKYGFDCHTCSVLVSINEQSPDIKMGVDKKGAGDQGMMFGFACDETPELMPLPIVLAHKLSFQLAKVRKSGALPYLRPDGKTQVTIAYDENGCPSFVDTIVISSQHSDTVKKEQIENDLRQFVIAPVVEPKFLADTKIFVNPTGKFVVGGPNGDCGLTGRKIIVDTYGGYARHGGGAFSGKDPTKVDRSASYAARYVAKNIVAAGLAKKCEVQLAYAIGVDKPVSILIDTFGTESIPTEQIYERVVKHFDLTPFGIIEMLDLRRPIYRKTAAYGHFGRTDISLPWELTDKANLLKN